MTIQTAKEWRYVKRCSPAWAYRDLLHRARRGQAVMLPEPRGPWRDKWYRRINTKFVLELEDVITRVVPQSTPLMDRFW